MSSFETPSTTLGIVRGISYGLFGPPDPWVRPARDLGARLVRVYLYWSQIQPRPGAWDWSRPDALLRELDGDERVWVTVCSSSPWGTRVATDFQPPSPATDDEAYERFVAALVRRMRGRVRLWQCNNEVSNTGMLWAGDANEYAHQLEGFARAVRSADPDARVVLAGCGYDVLSSPPDSEPRRCYQTLAAVVADDFDVFALNLYGDPYRIPGDVAWARELMRGQGYERPVVVGEYNGPTILEFPEAEAALQSAMLSAFAEPGGPAASMSTGALAEQVATDSPDRVALRRLYASSDEQPTALRMFLHDAPEELRALRDRIACRQLVQRAVLIRAAGVDTLACWQLAPEIGGYTDPFNVMDLLFGSLALMDYQNGAIARPREQAGTHKLLTRMLHDAHRVERVETDDEIQLYRFDRTDGRDGLVGWVRATSALDERPLTRQVPVPWTSGSAIRTDAFGDERAIAPEAGALPLVLTTTPAFVTPAGPQRSGGDA